MSRNDAPIIERIAGEPTRWFVRSSTRRDYTFVVDSDWESETEAGQAPGHSRGWACGCEQFMVRGKCCHHIDDVLAKIMSKTKFPRAEAMAVAAELCREMTLAGVSERLIVAGSLRRRKPEVGDIEILYIPKTVMQQDPNELLPKLVAVNQVDVLLDDWLRRGVIAKRKTVIGAEPWGAKNKLAVHVASGLPVDFFTATAENWFNYLVCRTGSADNNLAICNAAIANGWKWNPYGPGFSRPCGLGEEQRAMASERAVFEFAGLKYKEPWER